MWDLLKKADIEQAKQELRLRRAAALSRHAEESQNLDADRVEAETLNCLIDLFVQKLAKPPKMPDAPAPASISTQKIGAKTPPEGRHQHHRDPHHRDHHPHQRQHQDRPQTVFATFMRAASRG